MTEFKLEMRHGQDMRRVDADSFTADEASGWMIFYRANPQGGRNLEYWRVRLGSVVSMETKP